MTDARWRGHDHATLYAWINAGLGPAASFQQLDYWKGLKTALQDIDFKLGKSLDSLGASWEGDAAEQAKTGLTPLKRWAGTTEGLVGNFEQAAQAQADHIAEIRSKMPFPQQVSTPAPSAWQQQQAADATGAGNQNPAQQLAQQANDHEKQETAVADAAERAVQVMNLYEEHSQTVVSSLPTFVLPPKVSIDAAQAKVKQAGFEYKSGQTPDVGAGGTVTSSAASLLSSSSPVTHHVDVLGLNAPAASVSNGGFGAVTDVSSAAAQQRPVEIHTSTTGPVQGGGVSAGERITGSSFKVPGLGNFPGSLHEDEEQTHQNKVNSGETDVSSNYTPGQQVGVVDPNSLTFGTPATGGYSGVSYGNADFARGANQYKTTDQQNQQQQQNQNQQYQVPSQQGNAYGQQQNASQGQYSASPTATGGAPAGGQDHEAGPRRYGVQNPNFFSDDRKISPRVLGLTDEEWDESQNGE
jgi:hypothetical protein